MHKDWFCKDFLERIYVFIHLTLRLKGVSFHAYEEIQAMSGGLIQMDLSPALAKFYLAQINPILGQIVGPSFGREDLPDVSMSLKPTDMMWPTTEYLIRIEPMKVVSVYFFNRNERS